MSLGHCARAAFLASQSIQPDPATSNSIERSARRILRHIPWTEEHKRAAREFVGAWGGEQLFDQAQPAHLRPESERQAGAPQSWLVPSMQPARRGFESTIPIGMQTKTSTSAIHARSEPGATCTVRRVLACNRSHAPSGHELSQAHHLLLSRGHTLNEVDVLRSRMRRAPSGPSLPNSCDQLCRWPFPVAGSPPDHHHPQDVPQSLINGFGVTFSVAA